MSEKKSNLLFVTGKVLKAMFITGFCAMIFAGISGCRDSNLISSSYNATDMLIGQIKPPLIPDQAILVASFVNIDNLEESSTFGRTISEYIASRLTQNGYKVVEMKLRKSVFMKKDAGEFVLSRDLDEIKTRHNAQSIVLGTYSAAKSVVYISARMVRLSDNTVMASYGYKLPVGKDTRQMLGAD
ncbi:MAG: hypothetical protein BWK80_06715 [Desulfobacteraceae bacterium IS3]|nr:MAG: hypothetical protein BWK80_06715 [Desulfobacteraceae bacterium IS3]